MIAAPDGTEEGNVSAGSRHDTAAGDRVEAGARRLTWPLQLTASDGTLGCASAIDGFARS
jgi:hypothetical protein